MTVTGLAFSSPESSTPLTHAYFLSAYILGFPCQNLRKKKQSQLLKLNYKAEDVAHLVQGPGFQCCITPCLLLHSCSPSTWEVETERSEVPE